MSRRQLALKAGISENTLSGAFRRRSKKLDGDTVRRIAKVLDVPWFKLYDEDDADLWIPDMTMDDWRAACPIDEEDQEFLEMIGAYSNGKYHIQHTVNIDTPNTRLQEKVEFMSAAEVEIMSRIADYLIQLNMKGQNIALERIEELTLISKYRKDAQK